MAKKIDIGAHMFAGPSAAGTTCILKRLGSGLPVVWHGDTDGLGRYVGHPVVDGLQCSRVSISYYYSDISHVLLNNRERLHLSLMYY